MGKRNTAKSGGASAIMKKQLEKKAAKAAPRPVESDEESEESGNYMTFNKKSKDSDDEEEDEEVFNMALDKDDDEESDESESESEGDDSEEDDDEDEEGSEENSYDEDEDSDDGEENETERDLKELVSNLPANLRQQILKKEAAAKRRRAGEEVPDSEEEDEESEAEEDEGWGRKKKTYWEGDTADLEIGQEMEDALDEEEAAQELHREKTKRMKASDFMEDFEASDDDNSDSDEDDDNSSIENYKNKNGYKTNEVSVGDLATISLGQDEIESDEDDNNSSSNNGKNTKIQIEKLTKNIDHLTKKQRLDMISKNSPELLGIVNELKDQIGDLKGRIIPVKEFIEKISSNYQVKDDIVDYLEIKSQLLLSYCINVVYYLYMKSQGKSISNHPVMKQLLKLRYVMEKMRPLDSKLKHQIDRLIQLSELSPSDLSEQKSSDLLRPNPMALLSSTTTNINDTNTTTNTKKKSSKKSVYNSDNSSNDEDEDDSDTGYSEQKEDENGGIYKVPKRMAVPYKIAETILDKKEAKIIKQKEKIKRSELMDTLREEFGSAPEAAASSGLGMKSGDLRKLQEEADERRDFEEERFVRLTMSRKEKQSNKRRTAEASRLDNFDDIGDIGDFEEISKLAGGSSSTTESMDRNIAPISKKTSAATGSALQRAVMALAGGNQENDDEDLPHSNKDNKAKMRAMAAAMGGDSDEDDPYAALLAAGPDGDNQNRKRRRAPIGNMNDSDDQMDRDYGNSENSEDDENLVEDFAIKKKKYLAEKKSHYTAEPKYAGYEDIVQDGSKRAASYEIIKNKGLTPHRKKANRNPRVKKREMFDKAVIRRKGQVRDVISGAAGAYGGELTGIKSNLARSRKIGV